MIFGFLKFQKKVELFGGWVSPVFWPLTNLEFSRDRGFLPPLTFILENLHMWLSKYLSIGSRWKTQCSFPKIDNHTYYLIFYWRTHCFRPSADRTHRNNPKIIHSLTLLCWWMFFQINTFYNIYFLLFGFWKIRLSENNFELIRPNIHLTNGKLITVEFFSIFTTIFHRIWPFFGCRSSWPSPSDVRRLTIAKKVLNHDGPSHPLFKQWNFRFI